MKALVKKKNEQGLWLEDVPEPKIGINDVLIKMVKTSICGTDVHIYNWDDWAQRTIKTPMTIGHEFVGVIEAIGSNVSGFTTDSGNNYNLRSTSVLGDNIHAFYSNQILIGRGFSTENTNNETGIYFGWSSTGFTKPSMGFVENNDPNSDYYNFAMGGLDVFTSGETTGIFHEGAGSGNFFLYRDGSTVEPYDIIPSAVALFAKESPRGVTGLAVKAENNTYSMFTDTVSIGFTGGTAMLEVKSKGDTDSTDALNIKNSNDAVGLRITDGLDVYMPNLPITPGGLSAGGLYVDNNIIKVV